jgi:tryptophanyl-tRNA synthetase
MKNKVDPWNVEGSVDYEKLIKEFGVQELSKENLEYVKKLAEKKKLDYHMFLKRNLFYAHMDFDKIVEAHKNKENIFLYTGRAPGGSMHIGHMIPFLFTKYLQDLFDCNLYIQIPDDEKFLFKKDLALDKIEEMCDNDLDDLAAFGFDVNKTFIFRNSEYIDVMYPLILKTAKKLTFSQIRNTFGFTNDSNVGQIFYPALQIVPSFFEKGYCLIPCAIDQNPYFLLQRDIAKGLGFNKNSTILSKFLTSLTGPNGKMSASESDKAILLSDDIKSVRKKVNKYAFSGGQASVEEHREKGGNTDIDVSYQWLYYLFEEDDERINQIKKDYEGGKILSGELKGILIEKLNKFLEEHRKEKEKAEIRNLLEKYMYKGELAKKMWEKEF